MQLYHLACHCLLRYSRQIQYPTLTSLFQAGGQIDRREVRSDRDTHGRDNHQRLPATLTPHQLSWREHRKDIPLSDQQLCHTCPDSRQLVSLPLVGRTVLQVDQIAPVYQVVLWHFRERGEDADMDYHLCLCTGRHHQEATQSQHRPLHNFTDPESYAFRKNSFGTITCKLRL